MNHETLLHRVIKPCWWLQSGDVSSQASRPGLHDDKQMSVYDGDKITAEASWHHYTSDPDKSPPSGVLAITVGECCQQALPACPDPDTFPEHVLVDFRKFGTNQTKKKSERLRAAAVARDWQFRPQT